MGLSVNVKRIFDARYHDVSEDIPVDGTPDALNLADGSVTNQKLANGIAPSKVSPGTEGQVLTTSGSTAGWADPVGGSGAPTGAAGGDLAGSYPNPILAGGSVSTPELADGGVSTAKIADGAVTSGKITDGTITNTDVSASAGIAATKIQNTAVTLADTGTVTSGMLAGSIAPSKVSGTAVTQADTGTVTNGMLAGSVSPTKVTGVAITQADTGSVTNTMLAGSVSPTKITAGSDTQVLTTSGSTVGWAAAGSGSASGASLRWYDTKDYGAKSDLTRASNATVTGGNATISGTTYSGTGTDAGKLIRVQAAGAQLFHGTDGAMSNATIATKNRFTSAGATFDQSCVGRWIIITGQFTARIIGVESATQLRLATPASGVFTGATWTINDDHYTTIATSVPGASATLTVAPIQSVTSAIVWYGTDDSAAMQAAVTAAELAGNSGGQGNVVYHFGASALGSPVFMTKPTQFIGAGSRGYSSTLALGRTRLMLMKPGIRGLVAGGTDTGLGVNGSMTSGSAILTDVNANFQAGDVGKNIIVYNADTQTGSSDGNFLLTTILSRQSATQVTLNKNAGTTLTGAIYSYATSTGYTAGLVGPSVKNVHIVGGPGQLAGYHLMNSSESVIEEVCCSDFGSGVAHFMDPGPGGAGFSNNMELRSCYAMDSRVGMKNDRGCLWLTGQCMIDGNSNRVDCKSLPGMTIGVEADNIYLGGVMTVQAVGTGVKSPGRGNPGSVAFENCGFEAVSLAFDLASDGVGGLNHRIGYTTMGSSNMGGMSGVKLGAGAKAVLRRGYSADTDCDMFGLVDPAATLTVLGERVQKAGPISDADFTNQPYDGAIGVDTANNHLQIRTGGLWRFASTSGLASRVKKLRIFQDTSASATLVLTITGAVPVGHHVIVCYGFGSGSALTTTLADSKSNTYAVDAHADMVTGATPHAGIASAKVTTALVVGDTITLTSSGTPGLFDAVAYEYAGLAGSSWLDQTAGATGTGTAVSTGNITTTQASEVVVVSAYNGHASTLGTATAGSGWTQIDTQANSGGKRLTTEDQTLFSTGTVAGTETLSISNDWAAVVASYKAA